MQVTSNNGPDPPVRTSSLVTDEVFDVTSPPQPGQAQPPAKPPRSSTSSSQSQATADIPEPPKRTTSLHKSASVSILHCNMTRLY